MTRQIIDVLSRLGSAPWIFRGFRLLTGGLQDIQPYAIFQSDDRVKLRRPRDPNATEIPKEVVVDRHQRLGGKPVKPLDGVGEECTIYKVLDNDLCGLEACALAPYIGVPPSRNAWVWQRSRGKRRWRESSRSVANDGSQDRIWLLVPPGHHWHNLAHGQ